MEETLDVLHIQQKGRMMNTLESFHIYEAHKQGTQLNEALTEHYNPIFETVIKNQLNNNLSMTHNQTISHPSDNAPPPFKYRTYQR
jgi:hypothetical protein